MFKCIKIISIICCFFSIIVCSCTKNTYNSSIESFSKLEKDILVKFGESAYFTDFTIHQNLNKELEVDLLVTPNPYAFKMEGWCHKNGNWQQISQVDLELENGNIKDYLYKFEEDINLVKIGDLVNKSITKAVSKGFKNVSFKKASILSPDKGIRSQIAYLIFLNSLDKTISYKYNLQGNVINEVIL